MDRLEALDLDENTIIAFCYDNEKDPYQLHRIPFEALDAATGSMLKNELYQLFKQTNDRWFQEEICLAFLKDK